MSEARAIRPELFFLDGILNGACNQKGVGAVYRGGVFFVAFAKGKSV